MISVITAIAPTIAATTIPTGAPIAPMAMTSGAIAPSNIVTAAVTKPRITIVC